MELTVKKLTAGELPILTELFDYNDIDAMLAENARDINGGAADIFTLFDGERLIGELHAKYESADPDEAARGRRAYLSAFRIRKDYRSQGLGKYLLKSVLDVLSAKGYTEFTIGVEDDNERAKHIYAAFGFTELIARKYEEYQGDGYEYGLYLKKLS